MNKKQELLTALYTQDNSKTISKKPIYSEYENIVPGEGSPNARIMIIGEAPGETESKTMSPFIGRSGKILRELLKVANIPLEEIYITNVIKWRPPHNRAPTKSELAYCFEQYLSKEIDIIQPAILCTLGTSAFKTFIPGSWSILKIHGNIYTYKKSILYPTIHPSFTRYSQQLKFLLLQDLKTVKEISKKI